MVIETTSGKEVVELDVVTELRVPKSRCWVNIEKLRDGKWRLVYTTGFVEDIDALKTLGFLPKQSPEEEEQEE